jgi:hypothetical protein
MATKNLIIFQQELQVTVIISLACYVATARVRCTIQYLPKVPEWKVGKREKWKVRVPLFSYFPLLPFFPSGLFSEDSVAKKVNNRGKHFFLYKESQLAEYISQILLIYYIPTIEMLVKYFFKIFFQYIFAPKFVGSQ